MYTTFQAFKSGKDPIGYLIIIKKLYFSNQYEKPLIRSICLETRQLYKTMQHTTDNTTNYLFRFHNAEKENEKCNGILLTRRFQEHWMKILYQLHVTNFYSLHDNGKKDSEIAGGEMICAIL